ncbi:transcriptional regulator GcvA [Luteimonas sp. TWI662]|uniref:transcriptional regulator GcvA n=1 Tax=Luteimonas sp. TWI662 TaxID=3136789 RepID=UPI00320AFC03
MRSRRPAPLNALRTFEAAARHLSFNAAARQLFVTPAAVSHQVKQLEAYLGLPLFQRHHRAVELTEAGQALAATLGEVFGHLDRALDQAMSQAATVLRVTTLESFAAKWLVPRLHRFHRVWPGIQVRIETGDAPADFVRDGLDVGLRYGAGGYTEVHAERLMDAAVFPVCAPALLLGPHPLRTPADLRHHTLLHDRTAVGRPGVPGWSDWLAAAGAAEADTGAGPVFTSAYLAQEAAIAGHGVALGIGPLVADDLQQGRLVQPYAQASENAYAFWLVRRDTPVPTPAVDAFCQWLRDEASNERAVAR